MICVDALAFDAYGTLYDVYSITQTCELAFPGRGTQLSQLWRAKQLEYSWQRSLMGRYKAFSRVTADALEYACAALGLALRDSDRARLLDAYLDLCAFPDAEDALSRLAGMPMAILSNGSPDMLEPLVRRSVLAPHIAKILSVEPAGIYKPHPSVYQLAADSLGVAKQRLGFVSSNCWDACGAASFGFQAIWINRSGAPVDRLDAAPAAILSTLVELPELLGR